MSVRSPQKHVGKSKPWLEQHDTVLQKELVIMRARETWWSWTRLLSAMAILVPWMTLHQYILLTLAISGCLLVVFVIAVRKHLASRSQAHRIEREQKIVKESLQRAGGDVVLIRTATRPSDPLPCRNPLPPLLDDGETWSLTAQEINDLELYRAPVGVFGILNRCSTSMGSCRLRDMLENPSLSPKHICRKQDAIRIIANEPYYRIAAMSAYARLRDLDYLLNSSA